MTRRVCLHSRRCFRLPRATELIYPTHTRHLTNRRQWDGGYIHTALNMGPNLSAGVTYNNDNENLSLYLSAGFLRDHWLFMDSITFDCDGEQVEWNFEHYNCTTGIIWGGGGIYEVYTMAHTDNIELIRFPAKFQNLSKLMNLFETAQTVRIRFRGDGFFDVTIPQNRIEQIIELWYLYQALDSGAVSIKDLIN